MTKAIRHLRMGEFISPAKVSSGKLNGLLMGCVDGPDPDPEVGSDGLSSQEYAC